MLGQQLNVDALLSHLSKDLQDLTVVCHKDKKGR